MSKRYNPFVLGGLPAQVNASLALAEMMARLVDDNGSCPVRDLIEEVHVVMTNFFEVRTAFHRQFSRAKGSEPVVILDGWRQGLEGQAARDFVDHLTPIHNLADELCSRWKWTAPFRARERILSLEKILGNAEAPVRPSCMQSDLDKVRADFDVIGRPIPMVRRIVVKLASASPKRWVDLSGCQRWPLDRCYVASQSIEPSPPGARVLVRDDAAVSPRSDVEYWFILKAKDGNYYAFGASRWEWRQSVARDIGTPTISTMFQRHGDLLQIHPSERVLVALTAEDAFEILVESGHSNDLPDDLGATLEASGDPEELVRRQVRLVPQQDEFPTPISPIASVPEVANVPPARKKRPDKRRKRDGSQEARVNKYLIEITSQYNEMRKNGEELPPLETQKEISNRLGVSRSTVSRAAGRWFEQYKNLIRPEMFRGWKTKRGFFDAQDSGDQED